MNKKKRLFYERPQQDVVELEVKACLLAGSDRTAGFDGDPEEEDMS